ncbi:MAG: ATP-binding protein [Myxococcota bacterium]
MLDTLIITASEYRHVASVETELEEDLPRVSCRAGEINQVLLNVIVNAAHAIADVVSASGAMGRIRVRTQSVDDGVRISVADSGGGIPEAIRDRIFDPFFTTKDVGRGTGQGLAIARAIVVDHHGGQLDFETEPGRGTTFHILLPRVTPTRVVPSVAA